ncbi:MAG: hypothetical protein WAN26_06050, partial [Steroidobacteraceae bacterium]
MEKSLDRVGAGVHGRGAQARERQMRKPPCEPRGEPLQLSALARIECAQLAAQSPRDLERRDLFEV